MLTIVTSLASAISTTIATIGPSVASFCTTVLPKIGPFLDKASTFLSIAQTVLQVLQIFQPDDRLDDIGDRAIQAAENGIRPDDFDNFDDYMNEVRSFQLAPERSDALSPAEKYAAALAVASKGLDEKFNTLAGTMANLWLLPAINPDYFNATRLTAILGKTSDVLSIVNYFTGKLRPTDAVAMEKTLIASEQTLAPEKTEQAIFAELDGACRQAQQPTQA